MGAAPLGARDGARSVLGRVGGRRTRSVGSAGCRASPRSPTASARSIGAPAGSVFLGPNVSVLQAAIATCLDFRGERNEVVYEALQFPSLTYVWREWERYGAARASSRPTTAARFRPNASSRRSPKARRSRCSRTRTTSPARSPTFARFRRTAGGVGALLCVDAYQTTGVYPYDVTRMGSRPRDRRLAQVALRRSRLRLDLREAVAARAHFARRSPAGWRTSARSHSKPAPIDHAPSMYRFGHGTPTIPGLRRREARARHHPRASASRTFASTTSQLTQRLAAMALERGLRVNYAARAGAAHRLDRHRLRRRRARLSPADRAARLRRLPSRLRHSRQPALLHDRRRDRQLLQVLDRLRLARTMSAALR